MRGPRYRLEIELPVVPFPIVLLRRYLKAMKRQWGIRCLEVREVKEEVKEQLPAGTAKDGGFGR